MRMSVLFVLGTIAHGTGSGDLVLVVKTKLAQNVGLLALRLKTFP